MKGKLAELRGRINDFGVYLRVMMSVNWELTKEAKDVLSSIIAQKKKALDERY